MKIRLQGTRRRTDANKNLIKGNEEKEDRKVKCVREKVAEKDNTKEAEHSYQCPEEMKTKQNENEN